jgi:poly-gamma-glutamate system protein
MKFLKLINIRSNFVLLFVAVLSLGGFYIVENNKIMRKGKWYDEKLEAARLCQQAGQTIKNFYYGDVEYVDNLNDPNETGLIGYEYSPITSERGSFSAKSTSTNPNFAALVVQFLKELDLKEGDHIAVGMTGSFPALNIAVCAALQTLKLKPVIICSVASSSWGANDPDFTWLDMTKVLSDSGMIHFKPVAASIGASHDIGRGLSLEGVEMIKEAISRNGAEFIYYDSIQDDIARRMEIYDSCVGKNPIKVYINIGGGIASLGSVKNGDRIPTDLNEKIPTKIFKDKKGVIYEMAKRGIPVIHMLDIPKLAKVYDLPERPIPMPSPGTGELFESKKYDMAIVTPITLALLAIIIFIVYQDKKNVRLGKEILRAEQKNDNDIML